MLVMAAKPIIDILVGVADLDSSRPCIELFALESTTRPTYPTSCTGSATRTPHVGTHHFHIVPTDTQRSLDGLSLRDCRRGNRETARAYEHLKTELAVRYRNDREAYTHGKSDFVRKVPSRATSA